MLLSLPSVLLKFRPSPPLLRFWIKFPPSLPNCQWLTKRVYYSLTCPQRGAWEKEYSQKLSPFEWKFVKVSLPSTLFGHVMTSLFGWMKKYLNLSITLRRGSMSGFLFSSLFLCCPKPSLPYPPPPETPRLSEFLLPPFLCAGSSTQAGVGGDPFAPFCPYL